MDQIGQGYGKVSCCPNGAANLPQWNKTCFLQVLFYIGQIGGEEVRQ
jgi:hypothetical protein